MIHSVGRLRGDLSRMLEQQEPDVVFTSSAPVAFDGQIDASGTVGAHVAVLR